MNEIYALPYRDELKERMSQVGVKALSDLELLNIILGESIKGKKFSEVAEEILRVFDSGEIESAIKLLSKIQGFCDVRGRQLLAEFEFFRRRLITSGLYIKTPQSVLPLLLHYSDRKQEHLIVISLTGSNEVIAVRCVSIGLVDSAPVHPREVFADVLTDRASAIILAHNHPSGDTTPSQYDFDATKKIKAAGNILKINLLDHVIFSQRGYYSFLENKVL